MRPCRFLVTLELVEPPRPAALDPPFFLFFRLSFSHLPHGLEQAHMTKKCEHAGCETQASFNDEGGKPAFCLQHAEDYMVDVTSKRCEHESSCTAQPSYNHPGSKVRKFCKQHAEDGMVHIGRHLMSCKHPGGCTRQQSHGYWMDGVASRCLTHKADLKSGLVINYEKRCAVKGCRGVVNWGPAGEQPTHCTKHGAPKVADGFVCIPKKSGRGRRAAASPSRRGTSGGGGRSSGGGAAKKARKAQPRRADTPSEESESEEGSEEESDSSDDEEYEGEGDSEPEPEPVKKRRIIWL